MPKLPGFPSIIRPVTNKEWMLHGFLPGFLLFTSRPENRNIETNLRYLGHAGVRLLQRHEIPCEVPAEGLADRLLEGIDVPSHRIPTAETLLLDRDKGLDLAVRLKFGRPLRPEFKAIRRNLADIAGLDHRPKTPVTAYGITLARFAPESVSPEQRLSLIELAEAIRPANVILGKAQPLYGHG